MDPVVVKDREETVVPERERVIPEREQWQGLDERRVPPAVTHVTLQPVAAPMILGLLSLASATFIVGAYWAGLYSPGATLPLLLPFVAIFGGLTQLLAGMWSFRARDGLGTILHGLWGSFWMAYGLFYFLVARGLIGTPAGTPSTVPTAAFSELGFWFVALAAISWVITVASSARNIALLVTVGLLSLSATIAAIAYLAGSTSLVSIAGWIMFIGGIVAWYTGSAVLLNHSFSRVVLPLGRSNRPVERNVLDSALDEPGVARYE